jgi:pantothenate kinase-related protein Tda10
MWYYAWLRHRASRSHNHIILNSRLWRRAVNRKGHSSLHDKGRSETVQSSAASQPLTVKRTLPGCHDFCEFRAVFSFFFSGVVVCIPLRSIHTTTHILFKQ